MKGNTSFFILFFLTLYSCQFFDKKTPDKQELLKEELKKIDWKQVDEFPTANNCDTLQNKELQKQCFFDYLIQNIQERINVDTLQIMYPEVDTISVKVTINPDATLQFQTEIPKEPTTYDIKIIDSILQNKLVNFPPIEPAIKRGIKVKTQFILPVIIKVEQ